MTADAPLTEARPAPAAIDACPVCRARGSQPFLSVAGRDYRRCGTCAARFLDPRHLPSREAEQAHYLHHENDPDDPGYRRFLSKLAIPLLARLPMASRGLDYGCGPGPALAAMLREAGHSMALYDPLFHPDPEPLSHSYDFVTCTETAEHFHRPAEAFAGLMSLVRPGGWLAVMTCFQTDDARFQDWHYRKDPTHVVFYREETLRHLAAARGWRCEVPVKDVALMQRPSAQEDAG
ncbi:class I SAM-dependent methyltransferase [Phreatobacter sp.]|uniref:class I SAM-dependent methyltransferase n=1 Tax=Phreatobacter sp. TaxID=1966341 RepID=UPI003F6EF7AF